MIYEGKKYVGRNNLIARKAEILSSQRKKDLQIVNEKFLSENPKKRDQKARLFTKDDWPMVTLLEIDQLWNPKNLEAKFTLHP